MCAYVQAHLLDDSVGVSSLESLLEFVAFGELAFRNVHEDVGDLEDVIDVGLDTASPFLDLVLVACDLRAASAPCARQVLLNMRYLEAFATLLQSDDGDVCKPRRIGQWLGVCRTSVEDESHLI